jgi:hypothetical protein
MPAFPLKVGKEYMPYLHLLWDVPRFWWHAFGAVVRPLFGVLGVAGILLASCSCVVRYAEHRIKKKSHEQAIEESKAFFRDTVWTPLLTYLALLIVLSVLGGPYAMWEGDEQRLTDYQSMKSRVDDLESRNRDLSAKVAKLSPPEESPNSLRRRTIKAAGDLQAFIVQRWENPNRPPAVDPPAPNQEMSENQRQAVKKWQAYEQETTNIYVRRYRDNLVSIALTYKNKGIPIGFLDIDLRRGPPGLYLEGAVGQGDWGDDIAQLRNLAYRVDAYDNIITIP